MTAFVLASTDSPRAFFATTENVYEVPFLNPENTTGLETLTFSTPVLMFLTIYSLTCEVRMFAGGSKVMSASASPTSAIGLRGAKGRSSITPVGGLCLPSWPTSEDQDQQRLHLR